MIFIRSKENKKVGINWLEFLAFMVSVYLIISKLCQFALWIGIKIAQMKGSV